MDLARARASLRLSALDAGDRLRGRHDALVPPRRLDAAGHSDFAAAGEELVTALTAHARLLPDSRVLDVGCGHGEAPVEVDAGDVARQRTGDTSRALMAAGDAGLVSAPAQEPVAVLDDGLPEEAVAYADEWVFERLREHRLVLTDLQPGSWSGREEHMHFQDVLVAVRDGA